MNRNGDIGNNMATIVVILITFAISILLIIVSGIIGGSKNASLGEANLSMTETLDSYVLLDFFLSDTIEVEGEERLVIDLIREMKPSSSELIFQLFKEEYSCDGKNVILVEKDVNVLASGEKPSYYFEKVVLLDFSEKDPDWKFDYKSEINSQGFEQRNFLFYGAESFLFDDRRAPAPEEAKNIFLSFGPISDFYYDSAVKRIDGIDILIFGKLRCNDE